MDEQRTNPEQEAQESLPQSLIQAATRLTLWKRNNPPGTTEPEPLDLSGLDLTDIELEALMPNLRELDNLEELNLANNKLTQIPPEISGLTALMVLNLDSNKISELPPEIGQLNNLLILQANNNNLTEIPPEIGNLNNLAVLEIRNNKVAELPREVENLKGLEELDISKNRFTEFPGQIPQITGLLKLNIGFNQIRELAPQISNLQNLETLDAGNNRLQALPEQLGALGNLKTLILNDNELATLPKQIESLSKLERMDISKNAQIQLPEEIGHLLNLQVLIAKDNEMSRFPPEIGLLSGLKHLDLEGNNLTKLSPVILGLTELEFLVLNKNQLSEFPSEIRELTSLKQLKASHNELTTIPAGIGQLRRLQVLDLDHNKLNSVPTQIGQLGNLQVFNLNNNNLTEIPGTISSLNNLAILEINNNRLVAIPQEMAQLSSLLELKLANNDLTDVPNLTELRDTLGELDLARNPLTDQAQAALLQLAQTGNNLRVYLGSASFQKLQILYPTDTPLETKQKDLQIGRFNREETTYRDGNLDNPNFRKGDAVADVFLAHIEANHGGAELTQLYHNATRQLFDRVLGGNNEEASEALTQLASAIGNCPTPVHDFMEKTAVQMVKDAGETPSETLKILLYRQAFEAAISNKRMISSTVADRIEGMQGLTNALFLEGAETNRYNKIKITGNRPRIASKSQTPDFAFAQVTDEMQEKFAKLCCQTNENEQLVTDEQGRYQLDPKKYYNLAEKYIENQGILDAKAMARKDHIEQLKELIVEANDANVWTDTILLDYEKIEDELRWEMKDIPEDQIETVLAMSLERYKDRIQEVISLNESNESQEVTEPEIAVQNQADTSPETRQESPGLAASLPLSGIESLAISPGRRVEGQPEETQQAAASQEEAQAPNLSNPETLPIQGFTVPRNQAQRIPPFPEQERTRDRSNTAAGRRNIRTSENRSPGRRNN